MNETYEVVPSGIEINGVFSEFWRFVEDFAGGNEKHAIAFLACHLGVHPKEIYRRLKITTKVSSHDPAITGM